MKTLIFPCLALLYLLFAWGCDERITPSERNGHFLQGASVKNLDNDSVVAEARVKRNDTVLTTALIRIKNDTLKYVDSSYLKSYPAADSFPSGYYHLRLTDPGIRDDSVAFYQPADFSISSIVPDTRLNPGGSRQVRISWLTSAGSNGYSYGVVRRNLAYQTAGYTQFVITGVTSITIPPDAFRLSGNLDTGWYYIYVYAYYGAPIASHNLPTSFPTGIDPNITRFNFTGSWGAITVSPRDSMYITTLP